MLVQAQVVPWWGTGRPAECSLSGSHPVAGIANGRRIGGYDYKTESFQRPRAEHYTRFREIRNSNFFGAPPLGVGVFGKLPAARKQKDRQRNRLARSQRLRLSQEPKARGRSGSADRTAPEHWQAPGLRELRFAVSQQILPLTGNRKPASDRAHWIQPAPCSSRRRSCPGGERGDRQSAVSADPTPSRASPTGRRIGGYDYKTEAFQRPRAEHYTHFREIRNSNFLVPPPLGGRSVREITSREETERPPENRLGRSQHAPASPRNRKPGGDLARQLEPPPTRAR